MAINHKAPNSANYFKIQAARARTPEELFNNDTNSMNNRSWAAVSWAHDALNGVRTLIEADCYILAVRKGIIFG